MKFKLIAIVLLLASISFGYAFNDDPPSDDQTLRQLHQERIDALTKVKRQYLALEEKGLSDLQGMSTATIRLERAKFEAAETDQQRLAALEEIVNVQQKLVKNQTFLRDRGAGDSAKLFNAEADLLTARIELEEFKLKMKEE